MSNMDDIFRTFHTLQKGMEPLQALMPMIEQTKKVVEPLQPVLEQVRQVKELSAIASNPFSINNDLSYILKLPAQTEEICKLQKSLLDNDSISAASDYVQKLNMNWSKICGYTDIAQRSMQAQNIAMLRLLPDYLEYKLPYGVKDTVKKLSKNAAKRVAEADDILYDTKDRKFYHEEEPEKKVAARTITVITSSIELFADITVSQLIPFISKLADNKTFAINHPVGKHIYEIIQSWNTFIDFDCEVFYHARPIEGEEKPYQLYLEQEMLKAPPYISSHGRFNEVGSSCYYFADKKEGAINEIKKHCSSKTHAIEVAEIKPKRSIKMIDLSEAGLSKRNNFVDYIRLAASNNSGKIKKEYLLPNFVAACCREAGIEGIKYYSSGYNCYVTWQDDYFSFVDFDVVDI